MKKRDIRFASIPSTEEVAAERERLAYQSRYQRVLRSTIYILVVVAAAAVLLATLFLPVLQVSGDSMNPTLNDKDIILLVKSNHIENGELCGFYWQNKLLLKRVDRGRMRHPVPLSGAGKPLLRAGRPPLHLHRQPQQRDRLR